MLDGARYRAPRRHTEPFRDATVAAYEEKIVDRAINGRGIRDIVRVLKINKGTAIATLKKERQTRPNKSK
ncbi:MAG TPA: hypothetical protein ENK78_07155 [Thiothrix sp.]|nr:hypothetical protein [Thiothrix sp.]